MRKILLTILILFLAEPILYAHNRTIDSLLTVLSNEKDDTNKVNTLHELAWQMQFASPDSAIKITMQALSLSRKNNWYKWIGISHHYFGVFYKEKGDYTTALKNLMRALEIWDTLAKLYPSYNKLELARRIASTTGNIGVIYYQQGNYPKALESYFKALAVAEKLDIKNMCENNLGNIAAIYFQLSEYDTALNYFQKSLELAKEVGDKEGVARQFGNIGNVYLEKKDTARARDQYRKALSICREMGDTGNIGLWNSNLGGSYSTFDDFTHALEYYLNSMHAYESVGDKNGMATDLSYMGDLYIKQKDYSRAEETLNKGLKLSEEIGALSIVQDIHQYLSKLYSETGNWQKSLNEYKQYINARDSLFSQETTKKLVREQMNFDFEKQQALEKAEQDKKEAIQKEQNHKQKVTIYFISGILILVLGFAVFAYRSYLQKQRANRELDIKNRKIESAYHIIEEKNREITDSINYAQRIQNAMLPDRLSIQKAIPQSFILFKPKDIVSGDFYFFHNNIDSNSTFIAAADCTGHGVPGAFMSLINAEKLADAVTVSDDTGKILSYVNNGVRSSLHQSEDASSTRDGMDIALCRILPHLVNKNKVILQYSGANRPLWVIRTGANDFEEHKPTKKAIGGFTEEGQVFESKEIELGIGDTFYIFTDGYADQFGGQAGKKLTTRKFRELLLSLKNKPIHEQLTELDKFIENWKGNQEQLDDILVIGVRI